jgi:hypothetical protein
MGRFAKMTASMYRAENERPSTVPANNVVVDGLYLADISGTKAAIVAVSGKLDPTFTKPMPARVTFALVVRLNAILMGTVTDSVGPCNL